LGSSFFNLFQFPSHLGSMAGSAPGHFLYHECHHRPFKNTLTL
jgi:hypothetical protein